MWIIIWKHLLLGLEPVLIHCLGGIHANLAPDVRPKNYEAAPKVLWLNAHTPRMEKVQWKTIVGANMTQSSKESI